jgi:PAS domain S-box-containing protein
MDSQGHADEDGSTAASDDAAAVTRRLLDAVPDLAYVVDPSGGLRWWNRRLAEVTGCSEAELAGKPVVGLVAPEQRDRARESVLGAGADRAARRVFDVQAADGGTVPHEFEAAAVTDDDGTVTALAGIARDISARRERSEAIRRQRDQLETLNRINEAVGEIAHALAGALTREEIEETVCDRLADNDLYRAVWIARVGRDGELETAAVASDVDDFLATRERVWDEVDREGPAAAVLRTGEVVTARDIRHDDSPTTGNEASAVAEIHSAIAVPISYRGTSYGVLAAYSDRPDAFSERELSAFTRLGEVTGHAINATQTERLLLSEGAVELEFEITDEEALFCRLTEGRDCAYRLEWAAPLDHGAVKQFVAIDGASADTVFAVAAGTDRVRDCRLLSEDDGLLFEFVLEESVVRELMDAGANTRSVEAVDGAARVVAELPRDGDARSVVDDFLDVYDDARFVAKRVVDHREDGDGGPLGHRLTVKQRDALEVATRAGYFEWPRESTAEEVADRLDVSSATLHYHLRCAQREIMSEILTDSS